jgi:hypothetical protein
MKICLINNLYKPYNIGGAEQVISLLVDAFEKENNQVFVISTSPKKDYKENNNYYLKSKIL